MILGYVSKLDAAILKKALEDLGEDELRRNQVIQMIRQWQSKQPHLSGCPLGE